VLLLDEPLAALDLKLRKQMQVEVKNLQERLQTTFVFVTHDQEEALVMSDRIAVMSQGRIEQLDRSEALYERPRTRFAADFLGVRNILEARVERLETGRALLRGGGLLLWAADDGGYRAGTDAVVGIRPERLQLSDPEEAPASERTAGEVSNALGGVLDDEIYLGDRSDWRVRVGELVLTVAETTKGGRERRRGERVTVSFPPAAVLRLEP
jgi:ABC-type Fe3+/spermidine/putrescine transport system ATPase subunit